MTTVADHQRFHLKAYPDLEDLCTKLGCSLPFSENTSVLGERIAVGKGKETPNRFVVQPMEGFDASVDGTPGELTFRRYLRYARGGAGLIWLEATAVMHEARSNPGQLYIHKGNLDTFRELVRSVKETARKELGREPVLIVQLTHSGRYSKPTGVAAPIIAHRSPVLDPKHNLPDDYPVVTDEYLDRLGDTFVDAARLAHAAGFDGVDIKSCHRYLMSELLASHTREGKYGGSLENRSRLLRETLEKISQEIPELIITTRMNAYDAISYPFGFGVSKDDYRVQDLADPLELIGMLKNIGIGLLNVSIGNPYYNPHFGRPFDFPIKGAAIPREHPLVGLERFVNIVSELQNAHPDLPVIGSGYSWLRHLMPRVVAGIVKEGKATLIGQGRGSFAYPSSVNDILAHGTMDPKKTCVTCSACTQIMRDGGQTGCVVRDSRLYGPRYRMARRFSIDRLQEEARRCRECEEATCTQACPAHVDVPRFIKAFAENDIPRAYEILHQRNVLPEMCAYVCPVEEQCQGGCLEKVFCENPIAVSDIQLVVARTARLQGITGVRVPGKVSGKSMAVIGGGPSGLAFAIRMLEKGHSVHIYEAGDRLGGTPGSTIPVHRFGDGQAEIEAILQPAVDAGRCSVHLQTSFGTDVLVSSLKEQHDGVFIGTGLTAPVSIEALNGYATDALEFLRKVKDKSYGKIPQKVAVVGGGNTAMDAAVAAVNAGARDVFMVYRRSFNEMPAWETERNAVLSAGVHLMVLLQPTGVEMDEGKVTGLRTVRTQLGEPDQDGRRRPEAIPGSETVLPVDLIIEATGQKLSPEDTKNLEGIEVTKKGTIRVDPATFMTSVPGVFAAGDAVNGGTTAVQAIAEGMAAAEAAHKHLSE